MQAGYYAILDRPDVRLAELLLRNGKPVALQLRLKNPSSDREVLECGAAVRALCQTFGIPFVLNDRIDLAVVLGADYVHLGQDDLSLLEAKKYRERVGSNIRIGISTHNVEQVKIASSQGADYLGFGPVFWTTTKENPDAGVGVDGLANAVRSATIPVVAIGGISLDRIVEVRRSGVTAVCLISAVNSASDVAAAARDAHRLANAPIQ